MYYVDGYILTDDGVEWIGGNPDAGVLVRV